MKSLVMVALSAVVLAATASPSLAAQSEAGVVLIRQPGTTGTGILPDEVNPAADIVTFRVLASPHRRIRAVRLAASSGQVTLDLAAERALRRWRYVPTLTGVSGGPEWLLVRLVYGSAPPSRLERSAER